MKILIADDDPQILRALRILLTARGYQVLTARSGAEALSVAVDQHPELVMLDLGMPELNGIEVIEGLRGWSSVPILVVSGRTGSADKVDALDAGADDYVTKPFAADELLARIRALTRRQSTTADEPVITFGDVTVDLAARQVTRRDGDGGGARAVRLTPTEWQILEVLLRNPRRLVTRQSLLTQVWGPQYTTDTGYLRLYLSQLRKKLEPEPSRPRYLLTEPGMGYRFTPDDA
ncbi:two-component system, OmpR family, KDP operon response regulator KdpE [Leifsonia sp. 98AMF]|uniref:response regulator n=1 Tax=unclassified Leifsonia TaxID=2663824 RepID=UPI00087AB4F3|nr:MULTISPECIES: response regulator [unclassified Leifsonia]SDH42093.1 two-component system, OmpR family, KDP operon response regulator KdpE [Leifsonia sp. 197AMF]SDI94847.1 two-component system, OmpR family, KDP operon response regulator KdpE [Leifsonia sp. 466MF]SDJ82333.1 two-component system, OmpR family, KDP operon response regulator KdpE [Leifsonia sp. 157MF]SDN98456.1 two-component system, OmpR family, KDP operon response regulator KdpE [Leifsonia sp. 509MF]SEN06512.1 two-component syst